MPARDALMDLEREGLVVSRPNGRYVIELHSKGIEQLFEIRLVLERLAVSAAANNHSEQNCAALRANLEQMAAAIMRNDRDAYVRADLEAHQLIWYQANNPYLLRMLNSIVGPIFMVIGCSIIAVVVVVPALRDLATDAIGTVEGTVDDVSASGKGRGHAVLVVGGVNVATRADPATARSLVGGGVRLRVYYLPNGKRLLSLETAQ